MYIIFQSVQTPMRLFMWIFVICYLIFQYSFLIVSIKELKKNKHEKHDNMIIVSIILLLIGDTVHEFYLAASYFQDDIYLNGMGYFAMLITAIFMSGYYIGIWIFQRKEYKISNNLYFSMIILFVIRVVLGLLPANEYITPSGSTIPTMRYISNIVFCIFGIICLIVFHKESAKRNEECDKYFKKSIIWGYISFLFYILHLLLYPINPAFGSMMMFKTIAYVVEIKYIVSGLKAKRIKE